MIITRHNINSITIPKQQLLEQGCTFLVNKDLTWTSNDVVSKFRGIFKTKKVGHAGSLDPFATGLLIVCIGKDTKKINTLIDEKKRYIGTAKLGAQTVSYDAEHPEIKTKHIENIDIERFKSIKNKFIGKLNQKAPVYSAKKHKGRRHYELSRQNIEVIPRIKEIEIFNLELIDYYLPFVEFEVLCSKGTYIRSLAYELGEEMGCGAYLFKLIRTQIGPYMLEDSINISDLKQFYEIK